VPFALLLQTNTKPIIDAAELLAPWERLAFLEMQMLERARSTFLVRWFGSATPISGLSVAIAIDNIDELRARFGLVSQAVRAGGAGPVDGPGLLEPLSGLAGGLAGAIFSPGGSMALGFLAARVKRSVALTIVATLNVLTFGLLPTAVGLLLILPLTVGLFGTLRPAQLRLVAELGPLLIAVRRFWDALRGPRDRLHPVVAAALTAGDALAGLVPFLLAGFAVAVTVIGPALEPLAVQFMLLADLSRTLIDLLGVIYHDTLDRLTDALTGRRGVSALVHGVFGAMAASFSHTGAWLGETWADLVNLMVASRAVVDAAVSGWWLTARPQIRALTVENPMIGAMRTFADQLGIVADAWKHSARPSPPPTPSSPGPLGMALALLSRPSPAFPTAPAIPPFPVTGTPVALITSAADAMLAVDALLPGAIPNPVALDDASWTALGAARHPGGVFAGRAAALRGSVTRAERARRAQTQGDLNDYTSLAQRLAGPEIAQQLPRLDSILAQLHDAITGARTAARLPVRDLADRPVLHTEIRNLRIRLVDGGDRAAADAWAGLLRSRLTARPALVPAGS
jgi:hypothetical protein